MNIYHNFKFSSDKGYDGKFGMLSTLIAFAGMFLVILTTIAFEVFKPPSAIFVPVIGTSLLVSYLASIYPKLIYLFCGFVFISFLLSASIIYNTSSYEQCKSKQKNEIISMLKQRGEDLSHAKEYSSKRGLRRCILPRSMGIVYTLYFLPLLLLSGYYANRFYNRSTKKSVR